MPTTLELSRKEWQPYIESARRRGVPSISAAAEQQRTQLLDRAREVAAELKRRFGVKRVILFGSVASAEWFTSDSDVDLAVEGLSADNFWEAWRLAEEIINSRPVDLVEIESAKASLLRAIHRYGREL
jgi:predicted nucleotidyltransferase